MAFRSQTREIQGVRFGRPEALVVALYVRDALGLGLGRFGASARRLEPRVPVMAHRGKDPEVQGQWQEWWTALLRDTAPAVRRHSSVDYMGALTGKEALREAAEPLLREGREWFVAHRRHWEGTQVPDSRQAIAERIARDELGRRRRAMGTLLFLPLPLQGQLGYGLGGASWLVTESLVADLPAFEVWLDVQMHVLRGMPRTRA